MKSIEYTISIWFRRLGLNWKALKRVLVISSLGIWESYKREYEVFQPLQGESIDAMFSMFNGVVRNFRANGTLDYTDYQRALKLMYTLDRSIKDFKVSSIEEYASYDTLTLCSNLSSSSRQR